jgi:hypothetical protein
MFARATRPTGRRGGFGADRGRYPGPVSFYDEVLRELVVALGAALFVAHGLALLRRRRDADRRAVTAGARSAKVKGASRAVATGRTLDGELVQVPLARSVAFCSLGFVMMIAGIASLTA